MEKLLKYGRPDAAILAEHFHRTEFGCARLPIVLLTNGDPVQPVDERMGRMAPPFREAPCSGGPLGDRMGCGLNRQSGSERDRI